MSIEVTGIDEVEAWSGGSILPPGKHEVEIGRAEENKSSGGHDQIELEFDAIDGSGSIRHWLRFVKTSADAWTMSLKKARALLDAAGVEPPSGKTPFPTAQLPGKRLVVNVIQKPHYQEPGKMVSEVVEFLPSGSAPDNGNGNEPAAADEPDLPF